MNKKQELSVQIKGKIFKGYRVIEYKNTGEMAQFIHYKMEYSRKDPRIYKVGQEQIMENVAKLILEDLIKEARDVK